MAAATSAAVEASIGWTGRSTSSPTASSPARPSVSATAAAWPRSPASMHARRTTAAGTSAALATASAMTPSSAPCRSPPVSRSPDEIDLLRGGPGEQRVDQPTPLGDRPRPGRPRQLAEPAIQLPDREPVARSRSRGRAQAPAVRGVGGRPGGWRRSPSRRRSGPGGARRPGSRWPAPPRRGRGGGGGRPGRRSWRCGPAWPPPALTPRRPRPGAWRPFCPATGATPSARGP